MLYPCGAIDFRNLNTLWASIIVETLYRCGIITAVICPGSRSTPLTIAFANHPQIAAIPILDERSAAFFALGKAKKTGIPTVLVCTSGTAGANFYPAVIEAKESCVPLIILTADRPAELRHCHAGQTIDQLKLYGNFPNWQCEVALPEANMGILRYLRQNTIQAWKQSLFPVPGVVHLNLPFRKPLAPVPQPEVAQLQAEFASQDFFDAVTSNVPSNYCRIEPPISSWQGKTGVIVAGLAQPKDPEAYVKAIALLSNLLSFPVLGEALSPIRNYAENYADLNHCLISTYDSILRQNDLARELIPDIVIQLGELPTSKQLRQWLTDIDVERWVVDPRQDNFDPLHGKTIHLHSSIEDLANSLEPSSKQSDRSQYCQRWWELENQTRKNLDSAFKSIDTLIEGKAAWLIAQSLPSKTPIFIANSMSVRNAEYFWQPNNSRAIPYFNRGANGIDGTLATALGMADGDRGILLTGDLALLHDTNGFLIAPKFKGHLTIVVINNNGGGIFEMLPVADLYSEFETYFATPQSVNLAKLCLAYGVEHQTITNWQQLEKLLKDLPYKGIRVLELNCDRQADAAWLKANLANFSLVSETKIVGL